MTDLKLLALDGEDLEVISTHVQDAILRVADMGFSKVDNRFALLLNRYVWDASSSAKNGERRRTAMHFDHVKNVEISGIDAKARDGVLELLSVTFEPGEAPQGKISLSFAGGGTAVLEVDCLEARLHDLGAAWAAKLRPDHALND